MMAVCRNSGGHFCARQQYSCAIFLQKKHFYCRCEWRVTCNKNGMLRITQPTNPGGAPLFVLEGRLAGEWVSELIRVLRGLEPGAPCMIDLEEVCYVDASGEEALRTLKNATYIAENAYGKDLCKRLHLHRRPTKCCGKSCAAAFRRLAETAKRIKNG